MPGLRILALAGPLVFLVLPARAQPPEPLLPARAAAAPGLSRQRLEALTGRPVRAAALVFLGPQCPLSQAVAGSLNALAARGGDGSPAVVGILPGLETGSPEAAAFRRDHAIRFVLAGDPDLELARALNARVTPEAFLLDSGGAVLYSGAVDDRAVDLGKKRARPRRVHLDTAVAQWAAGGPVSPGRTRPVGCFIQ